MICPFEHLGDCWGHFEYHHAIPRQTIKNNHSWRAHQQDWTVDPPLERVLADTRNLVPICATHHERVTNRRIYVTRGMLPEGIDQFAEELGLGWYMDRYYDHEDAPA